MNLLLADSWISLGIAIVFGVLGTISMKLSNGMQKLKPSVYLTIFYTISFVALTFAMKYIELSVVYAVWSGIGTILVAVIGIFHFNESVSAKKIFFLSLIVIGIIGMHFGDYLS
ncbi:DMT family transporter [Aquicella lusitana]|uniref:Small multidrug resistance pump n=1 Tax=Aquicella lusitana TaxID=254246 RepID=A0A370GYT2_9COXI|nr:multidrug efflux SMR transporter [Aquicella lusitana]RDI48826.1 small multidrug resistance pump [Aquicella lusitana]VVC73254.1 Multidrug resistance protein EbrA [Aquicella lusitana]